MAQKKNKKAETYQTKRGKTMKKEDFENLSFEEAMQKLETMVRELETGQTKLDDAVEVYEQAMMLKKFCEQKLKNAELKIEKIETQEDGKLCLKPLDETDEND